MNQINRQKVLDFCSTQDTYPLYFYKYKSKKDEFDPTKCSVDDLVRRVLTLSQSYPSFTSNTDDYDTSSERWRSSLDIWRHIIYYYPTVEIFDIMHSLYNMYRIENGVRGQFCSDVERRTFKIQGMGRVYDTTNYMDKVYMEKYQNRSTDEYGLDWEDWKDI